MSSVLQPSEATAKQGTFEWALIQMKAGKRVTRDHHPNEIRHVFWIGCDHNCFFDDDLTDTTWRVVEPEAVGDPDDLSCLHCCGDGLVKNDDPIQRGPSEYLICFSCGGSGKRKDMTVW